MFATALTSDADKMKSTADVLECLRTYDVLGLWREAEEIIRRNVVDSFVRKVCSTILAQPTCLPLQSEHFPRCPQCSPFPPHPTNSHPHGPPISGPSLYCLLCAKNAVHTFHRIRIKTRSVRIEDVAGAALGRKFGLSRVIV